MAQGRSPRVPGGAAAQPSERDRIIDAAFSLIAQQGWRRLSLAEIAAEAGLPILTLYRAFPSKAAILRGFSRRIDETLLATPLDRRLRGIERWFGSRRRSQPGATASRV